MPDSRLTLNCRKALCVQLGEEAGNEIADLLQHLAARVDELQQHKVDVTPIIPVARPAAAGSLQRKAA